MATENKGITLIELLVAISVIGILTVALGVSLEGWIGSYKAESEIKEIYADLMSSRVKALQKNRMYFVSLAANQYSIYEDTNPFPDGDESLQTNADSRVLQKNLTGRYPIAWNGGSSIDFTARGLSNSDKTICINAKTEGDYDCIEVFATRINMGRLNTKIPEGGTCDASNCVAK